MNSFLKKKFSNTTTRKQEKIKQLTYNGSLFMRRSTKTPKIEFSMTEKIFEERERKELMKVNDTSECFLRMIS